MSFTIGGRAASQGYSNIDNSGTGDDAFSSTPMILGKRACCLLLLVLPLVLLMRTPTTLVDTEIETMEGPDSTEKAASRVKSCKELDWQQACENVASAGARRRLSTVTEEAFLYSDDPSVTFDNNCLRVYRLDLQGNMTFPYHANHLIRAGGNETMTLFIQHGAMRDADHYFCSFRKLMKEQHYRPFEEVMVIAPDFNYFGDDGVLPTDAFWNSTKPWADWRVGAESDPKCCGNTESTTTRLTISSFEVLDTMLRILADKNLYPNMNKISYLGHSAGGQMVQRYAIVSELAAHVDSDQRKGNIDLEFIIANPSSYAYLDARRFQYNCGHCNCNYYNCTCNRECTEPLFLGIPDERKGWVCHDKKYNDWPYGLNKFSDGVRHSIPYASHRSAEYDARMYQQRSVVYMVGQNDTCNDGLYSCSSDCWKREDYLPEEWPCFRNHMDIRCPAMLEGPFRRKRGILYMKYLESFYGKPTHVLHIIPGVGHNATGIFGSPIGLEELFN